MLFGTRAILDQHQRECREDRERTHAQFQSIERRVDQVETKIDRLGDKNDQRHDENRQKLDKVLRYIWIATGMFAMLSFLLSHDGSASVVGMLLKSWMR